MTPAGAVQARRPGAACVLDGLMRGCAFGDLAPVIVPRTSDQYNKLYLYLREAARMAVGGGIAARGAL